MTVRTSAPGKLFLLGEYAVLDGAPALLTAVDRRATVTVEPSEDDHWHLSARGLGIESLALNPDGSLQAELSVSTRAALAVFDAVRSEVAVQPGAAKPGPLNLVIDTMAFQHDGNKLGLGSSAAVATALTAALSIAYGIDVHERIDNETVRAVATRAHTSAQNGVGSGGDVATSVYGGLLLYTRESAPIPVQWPDGVEGFALLTGTGSATVDLVAKVQTYADADPNGYRATIAELASLSRAAGPALDDVAAFLHLVDNYFLSVMGLDRAAKAGIVTEQHLRFRERATDAGGVFKTSGAGGGDLGLVFGPAASMAALNEEFRSAFRIPLTGHPVGWTREAA